MMLFCSAGHRVDTSHPLSKGRKPGERCGCELSYDRMSGTVHCRRILKAKQDAEAVAASTDFPAPDPKRAKHDFEINDQPPY